MPRTSGGEFSCLVILFLHGLRLTVAIYCFQCLSRSQPGCRLLDGPVYQTNCPANHVCGKSVQYLERKGFQWMNKRSYGVIRECVEWDPDNHGPLNECTPQIDSYRVTLQCFCNTTDYCNQGGENASINYNLIGACLLSWLLFTFA